MKVVCLCPSYGRPHTTCMSAWMFLQQQYLNPNPHKVWLYILDDSGTFDSEYTSDNIILKLHNERFPSISSKYNYMIKQAREWLDPDVFIVWENDDWYLPWHVNSYIDSFMHLDADFVHPNTVYVANKNRISNCPTKGIRFHGALAFSAKIVDDNFYPPSSKSNSFDILLLKVLNARFKRRTPIERNVNSYCWYCGNEEFPQGSSWVDKRTNELEWYNKLKDHPISYGNKFYPSLFQNYVDVINRLLPGSIDVDKNQWDIPVLEKNLKSKEYFSEETFWKKRFAVKV